MHSCTGCPAGSYCPTGSSSPTRACACLLDVDVVCTSLPRWILQLGHAAVERLCVFRCAAVPCCLVDLPAQRQHALPATIALRVPLLQLRTVELYLSDLLTSTQRVLRAHMIHPLALPIASVCCNCCLAIIPTSACPSGTYQPLNSSTSTSCTSMVAHELQNSFLQRAHHSVRRVRHRLAPAWAVWPAITSPAAASPAQARNQSDLDDDA